MGYHTGVSMMYLMGFVNSTFETRLSTGNLELVDLSLENKYHLPEQVDSRVKDLPRNHLGWQNGSIVNLMGNSGAAPIGKPSIARSRRLSVEDLPADLYMEPLVLTSLDGKKMPVYVMEKDLAPSREQELDHQEWSFWDLARGKSRMTTSNEITSASKFADGGVSTKVQQHPLGTTEEDQDSEPNSDSDLDLDLDSNSESESDRESRTRDTVAEKSGENDNVESVANGDNGYERILQHLERIEGSVKDLKARVDDAKLRMEQSAQEFGEEPDCDQGHAVPSSSPSLSSPVLEKMGAVVSPELPYSWNKKLNPSLLQQSVDIEPVMEERDLRYSPPIVESDVQEVLSFRLWEQEAPAPIPKRKSKSSKGSKELDLEAALDLIADEYANSKDLKLPLPNFRVRNPWDSVGKESKRDDAPTEDVKSATTKPSLLYLEALSSLKTFDDLRSRRAKPKVDVEVKVGREAEPQPEDFNPSPSSFTCGLSPKSLFSDDREPFQMSVSGDENVFLKKFQPSSGDRKSPRSVLSAPDEEPDETSHSASESSETRDEDCHTNSFAYLYNYESSDLESPMQAKNVGFAHRPFPTFTYNVIKEMGETSEEEDQDDDDQGDQGDQEDQEDQEEKARDDTSTTSVAHFAELEFFQDAANSWEPWLVKDGDGVLDDSDLEFLLSPDCKIKDVATSIIAVSKEINAPLHAREQEVNSKTVKQKTVHESPKRPKSWVPYVTGELQGNNASPVRSPVREGLPKGGVEKKLPPRRPKRSVNFAADLVREIPHSSDSTLDKKPAHLSVNSRANPSNGKHHGGERGIPPQEVEDGPSIMTSRRRWRKNRVDNEMNGDKSPGGSSRGGSSSREVRSGSRRQRVAQAMPCAGNLFSWPQRLAFKVSRGKRVVESDEEGLAEDRSFGRSARRDAEQVKKILKGNQKKYSYLSVAEIMNEDFEK